MFIFANKKRIDVLKYY